MRSRSSRLAAALFASGLVIAASPAAATAEPSPSASALDWIEGELGDGEGIMTTSYEWDGSTYTVPDWGLTLDAVLALAAAGRGESEAATTADALVADNIASYISGADFGAPDDRYAGPIAKALLTAEVQGDDVNDYGGVDLEAELLDRLVPAGDHAGRFSDAPLESDFSNGFGQALAIMALARLDEVPDIAVDFLLDQQCPGGGFRGNYTVAGGCTSDADATVDATGFALQALTALEPDCSINQVIADATDWLEEGQNDAGAFGGESGSNTNSTGLAAVALRSLGSTAAAGAAADFVAGLQLGTGDDAGAVALNAAGLASADDGIQILERDGFRRATTQGVLAFDLPSYAEVGVGAIDPADYAICATPPTTTPPPTTPTATLSATTVEPGDSLTITGTGFEAGETVRGTLHSAVIDLGTTTASVDGTAVLTFTVPADLEAGEHTVTLTGESSGTEVSATVDVVVEEPQTLPATGADNGSEALMGAGLVLLGAGLVSMGRRRSRAVTGR